VEHAFATVFGKTRSMLNAQTERDDGQTVQIHQCNLNTLLLEKMTNSPQQKWYPKRISNLRIFGDLALIARHSDKKIRNKLADRGNTVIFVGYSNIDEKMSTYL
jgi:hypothetical protein